MTASLDQLFHHITINRIVSQLQGPTHKLTSYYGMGPGGANTDDVGGEKFGWDLFDRTRNIATGRLRASGPATATAQKVGTVNATCYRMFEQTPLDYDRIYRKRGLGAPLGSFDTMGQKYLTKQISHIGEKFLNARETLIAWMFRGGFELQIDGDSVIPVPVGTGAEISVDFKHPAANQGTVGGIFAGNWQDAANAKPIQELLNLNEASMQNSRYPQTVAWCRATTAYNLLNSDEVKAMGGTANTVFADGAGRLDFTGDANDEGRLSNIMSFVLRGYPAMKWMVYDDVVTLPNGNTEPFLNDNEVLFTPDPSSSWLEWKNGSEAVQKSVGGGIEDAFGMTMWQETQRNPVAISLYALDNGLPAPYVPGAWYRATVSA